MNYQEIRIELPAEHGQPVMELLWERELGFQEIDQTTLNPPPPGRLRLHLYIPEDDTVSVRELLTAVHEAVPDPSLLVVETAGRDEAEWLDTWKQFFTTRRIGRIAIVPSWEAATHAPADGEITLHLDPGRAFGTGGHATTRLCLRLLDELRTTGAQDLPRVLARLERSAQAEILDVGCGCGVLAIAAVLLWPQARALAIDIDPESVEVTDENSERNGVRDRVQAEGTPIAQVAGRFALVLANLTGPTLLDLADEIAARVDAGAVLILSGLLEIEAEEVAARFVALGLALAQHETEEEWAALALVRPA